MPAEAPAQACYGLDIGAVSLVAARDDGELLRNECSDTSTKTVVSFSGKQRHLGEAAANSLSSNGRNTATAVGRLALMSYARLAASPLSAHWQLKHSERDGGGFEMEAQYNGAPRRFSGVQLLGALLAKVRATSGAGESPCVALVLPPCAEADATQEDKAAALAFARAAVLDAAEVGGWKPVALPTAMEAAAVALSRKYPAAEAAAAEAAEAAAAVEGGEGGAPAPARHVLLLDMGAASTNVGFIAVDAEPGQQLVAESGDAQLGCADFDAAVWSHFASHCQAVHQIEVASTRRGPTPTPSLAPTSTPILFLPYPHLQPQPQPQS
jgi:molecular chaperone DnaK (HSP70)